MLLSEPRRGAVWAKESYAGYGSSASRVLSITLQASVLLDVRSRLAVIKRMANKKPPARVAFYSVSV
jgi:hypothetical protein